MKTLLTLAAVVALSGCSALQAFGEASRELQQWEQQNGSLSAAPKPHTQVVREPTSQATTQPAADTYQLVMVNTPSGWVQKRCKMLNGKAVHCI